MTKIYFSPVHLKTNFRKCWGGKDGQLPLTEALAGRVLTLPFYPHMPEEEIDFVIDNIKSFFREG